MSYGKKLGLIGFLLALGAPLGAMGIHLVAQGFPPLMNFVVSDWQGHLFCYVYMTIGTTLAFTLFGFVVGRMSDKCESDLHAREREIKQIHLKRCVEVCHAERLAALGRVSSMLAHEVNNPLMGVRNAFENMSRERLTENRRKEYMELISGGLEKIQQAMADLLDLTRPSGNGAAQTGPVGVGEALDTALALSIATLKSSDISVVVQKDPDLPAVRADRNGLAQVFLNLILNAKDAMPHGGRLEIEIRRNGRGVGVQIRDTGSGIPSRHMEQVFEPFFTTKEHGTGLGLAVCRNILEKIGGRITARNHPQGGAQFILSLHSA